MRKKFIIAINCHYSGFSAIKLEKLQTDINYNELTVEEIEAYEKADKRWIVSRLIKGIASYQVIEKALKELQGTESTRILVNKGYKALLHKTVKIPFKSYIESDISQDFNSVNDFNASVFNLVALVNDQKIGFKKEVAELIETVKFYNPANYDNDFMALLMAVDSIAINEFMNELLYT